MTRSIQVVLTCLIVWGAAVPTQLHAAGNDIGGFGMKCKGLLQRFWDPWQKAAASKGAGELKQPSPIVDNIVVAPLWKMQGNHGTSPINWLRKSLPEMKEMGITSIYLPPMVSQTLYQFRETPNNHGYWGKSFDHKEIDPRLGTQADYLAFLKEAKEMGFKLTLDINIRHLGYFTQDAPPFAPAGGKIPLWGKELPIDDPNYFYQHSMSISDLAKAELLGPGGQDIITTRKMWDLPALNVSNPWVAQKIINDQLSVVDLGYSAFRIDAAKHIPSPFLKDVIQAMGDRVRANGGKPHFILEYLSYNYGELGNKLAELGGQEGLTFIDFPLSGAIRRSIVDGHDFGEISKELKKMDELGLDQRFFTQAITDQDAYYRPMYHGTDRSLQNVYAVTMASNVLSSNRPYYVAGLEQSVPEGTERNTPEKLVDTSSPAYSGLRKMNQYFNDNFEKLEKFDSSHVVKADGGQLIVKRPFKDGSKSLLMIIERSRQSSHINQQLPKHPGAKTIFRWGEFGGEVECFLAEVPN